MVALLLSACAPAGQAVQTAIVQTLTALPTPSLTPSSTSTFTPIVSTYSLELGVCPIYLEYGGDPKNLGCTLLETRSVGLEVSQEASASVTSSHPDAYSYCALFAMDGSYINSSVNPTPGAPHVSCGTLSTPPATAAPGTQAAILLAQAAAQTAEASEVAVARTAVEREVRAYATADSGTATAYFIAARATQTAGERQARASATSFSATATKAFKAARATEIVQYKPIDAEELLARPDDHQGEKVVIGGWVFDVHGKVIQIYVRGEDAIYVEMREPVSGIAVGQSIAAYGTLGGAKCVADETGAQTCRPVLKDAFYVKK